MVVLRLVHTTLSLLIGIAIQAKVSERLSLTAVNLTLNGYTHCFNVMNVRLHFVSLLRRMVG